MGTYDSEEFMSYNHLEQRGNKMTDQKQGIKVRHGGYYGERQYNLKEWKGFKGDKKKVMNVSGSYVSEDPEIIKKMEALDEKQLVVIDGEMRHYVHNGCLKFEVIISDIIPATEASLSVEPLKEPEAEPAKAEPEQGNLDNSFL